MQALSVLSPKRCPWVTVPLPAVTLAGERHLKPQLVLLTASGERRVHALQSLSLTPHLCVPWCWTQPSWRLQVRPEPSPVRLLGLHLPESHLPSAPAAPPDTRAPASQENIALGNFQVGTGAQSLKLCKMRVVLLREQQ